MYLEPIFGSEDIMQQLPLEGKRFATVGRMWRKTTEAAKRNPLVLKVGGGEAGLFRLRCGKLRVRNILYRLRGRPSMGAAR